MRIESIEEDRLVRYLLGELPDEDALKVEDQYSKDDDFFELIQAVEDELLRDSVKGELAPELRRRVESRYRSSPDLIAKLKFAEGALAASAVLRSEDLHVPAVVTRSDEKAKASFWDLFRIRIPAIQFMAATVVIGMAVFGLAERTENTILKSNVAQLQRSLEQAKSSHDQVLAKKVELSPLIATFVLSPGLTRGEGAPKPLVISADIGRVEFKLPLPSGIRYSGYRVVLQKPLKGEISSEDLPPSALIDAGRALIASIPSASFTAGQYILYVKGRDDRDAYEDVQYYAFTVEK